MEGFLGTTWSFVLESENLWNLKEEERKVGTSLAVSIFMLLSNRLCTTYMIGLVHFSSYTLSAWLFYLVEKFCTASSMLLLTCCLAASSSTEIYLQLATMANPMPDLYYRCCIAGGVQYLLLQP